MDKEPTAPKRATRCKEPTGDKRATSDKEPMESKRATGPKDTRRGKRATTRKEPTAVKRASAAKEPIDQKRATRAKDTNTPKRARSGKEPISPKRARTESPIDAAPVPVPLSSRRLVVRHVQTPPQTPHVQTSRKAPGLFNPITKPRPPAPPAPQMPAKAKAKAKAVPKILQKHGPKDQAKQDRETAARNRTAIAQRYGHAPKPAAAKTEKEPRVPKRAKKGTMRPRPVAVPAAVAVASRASVLPALAEARAEGRPEGTYLGYPVLAELPELAEQYTQAKTRREEAQAERDTVAGQIEALMLAADTGKVTCGAFVVIRVESEGRKSLSREKLLELGVPADTIAAATIQGEGFSYVKVERADEAGEKRHARKENSGGNGRRSGRTA